jgi:hypothetical protein
MAYIIRDGLVKGAGGLIFDDDGGVGHGGAAGIDYCAGDGGQVIRLLGTQRAAEWKNQEGEKTHERERALTRDGER